MSISKWFRSPNFRRIGWIKKHGFSRNFIYKMRRFMTLHYEILMEQLLERDQVKKWLTRPGVSEPTSWCLTARIASIFVLVSKKFNRLQNLSIAAIRLNWIHLSECGTLALRSIRFPLFTPFFLNITKIMTQTFNIRCTQITAISRRSMSVSGEI